MEKILREILADDKNILGRRNDLIAALDSKVPANLARDYAAVKKAINLGVAEKFAIGSNDKDSTKAQVVEILKASGLQDKRVSYVVDTFVNALDWDKPISNETVDHEETTTTVPSEQKNDSAATTTKQQADSSASWMSNSSDKDTQPEQPKKFFSERTKNIKPAEPTPEPSSSSTSTPPPQPQPQPRPQPQQTTPITPPPTQSDNKNKLLIGLVVILLIAIFAMAGNNSNSLTQTDNLPAATQNNNNYENYRNAKTELSLNGVDIWTSVNMLTNTFGAPDNIENTETMQTYHYPNMAAGVHNGMVTSFLTYDPNHKTYRGLHVGSTYSEVANVYGTNSKNMALNDLMLYEYPFIAANGEEGLLRFAVADNVVRYISMRVPEQTPPAQNSNNNDDNSIDDNTRQAAVAFVKYHEAITDNNYRLAYNLMTRDRQSVMGTLQQFSSGYKDTIYSEVTDLRLVSTSPTVVVMNYTLEARDRAANGRTIFRKFQGRVTMVKVNGEWKLDDAESKKIEEVTER